MLPNLPAVHAHVASSIITHLVFSCHPRPSATYFNQAPSTPEKQGGGVVSVASILQWSRVDWDSFEIAILIYLLSSHEQIIGKKVTLIRYHYHLTLDQRINFTDFSNVQYTVLKFRRQSGEQNRSRLPKIMQLNNFQTASGTNLLAPLNYSM